MRTVISFFGEEKDPIGTSVLYCIFVDGLRFTTSNVSLNCGCTRVAEFVRFGTGIVLYSLVLHAV
jgi:hypothetical protein